MEDFFSHILLSCTLKKKTTKLLIRVYDIYKRKKKVVKIAPKAKKKTKKASRPSVEKRSII